MTPKEVNVPKKLHAFFSRYSETSKRHCCRISSRRPVGRGLRKRSQAQESPDQMYEDQIYATGSLI